MLVFPNAKINLGLSITERRPDGYHNLLSCFFPIKWQDALDMVPSNKLAFVATGIAIPGNPMDNLVVKAWQLLHADHGIDPVEIHLHKIIPIGAGLGGGSADGAFAVKCLNDLFGLGLSGPQMEAYAGKLGSDCPFFIRNKPMLVSGTGNVFNEISLRLSGKYMVVVYPGFHIGTQEAYAGISPKMPTQTPAEVLSMPLEKWKGNLHNDFEGSLFPKHPELPALKNQFYESGALYASMSGSGSAVYGIFEEAVNFPLEEDWHSWAGWLGD